MSALAHRLDSVQLLETKNHTLIILTACRAFSFKSSKSVPSSTGRLRDILSGEPSRCWFSSPSLRVDPPDVADEWWLFGEYFESM